MLQELRESIVRREMLHGRIFRRLTPQVAVRRPITKGRTRWTWIMAALNGMTLLWMTSSAGQWFDDQDNVLAMVTWNGHHRWVAAVCASAFVLQVVMAALTHGFSEGTRREQDLLVGLCFVSLMAMAGVLALALPLAFVGVGIGLVGRLRR